MPWVIAPKASGGFDAQMEQMLDVYKHGHDPRRPVVCMDESPRQLIRETRAVQAAAPGRAERHEYECERCGVCNVFMAVEPPAGRRLARVTERKTKTDWAAFLQEIAGRWSRAEKITRVMDNLNTHGPGSRYEAFAPAQASNSNAFIRQLLRDMTLASRHAWRTNKKWRTRRSAVFNGISDQC